MCQSKETVERLRELRPDALAFGRYLAAAVGRAPTAKLPRIEDAIAKGGVLCGSPEQVIEHLKALERRYPGLDRVSVSLSVGVPKAVALSWNGSEPR